MDGHITMAEENLQSLQELMGEFNDLSLTDFRDAFHQIVKDKNPTVDRFLVSELKNWRGNRTIRAEFAAALALREDENYIEDFSIVIEKETEVGLCKECINGLSRIGSQLAIQKLEYLSKSKPNATILAFAPGTGENQTRGKGTNLLLPGTPVGWQQKCP